MDEQLKILLNSTKNVNSVNVDAYSKLVFLNEKNNLNEYDVKETVNVSDFFQQERENTQIYRIYGRFDYLSLLTGLPNFYTYFYELFNKQPSDFYYQSNKNLNNSFRFYLVRPSDEQEDYINDPLIRGLYFRPFKVITEPKNFEIYKIGFAKNVFNEQTYAFNFNVDVDVSEFLDGFGMPLSDLFLYVQYIPKLNEILQFERFINNETSEYINFTTKELISNNYVETLDGEKVGDYISYNRDNFYQAQYKEQTHKIIIPLKPNMEAETIAVNTVWKYNPLIPIKLRYFSNNLNKVNISNVSYDETSKIPDYATDIGGGNRVWRDFLPQGFIDPLTNIGVDYPFVNKRRYIFLPITFNIVPDLSDTITKDLFNNISFGSNRILVNKIPISNLNEIGKPC